jgi:hypothetical protein
MTTQAWLGVGARGTATPKISGGAIWLLSVVILLAIELECMPASNPQSHG